MLSSALLAGALALGANAHCTHPPLLPNQAPHPHPQSKDNQNRANASSTKPDTFPSIQSSGAWEQVRQADNWQNNGFVGDVTSPQMACFQSSPSAAAGAASVAAGSSVTYHASPNVYHPGPMHFYMAKVPEGGSFDSFDGSGDVWFKIYEEQPNFGSQLTWPSNGTFFSAFPMFLPLHPSFLFWWWW